MGQTPWIIGNWKMKGSWNHAQRFAEGLQAFLEQSSSPLLKVGICPPFPFLAAFKSSIGKSFLLGGQDCAPFTQGAHTGDVGAEMLQDMGCTLVLIGHSERRQHHGEGAACLRQKISRGIEAGLKIILCVGETQQQRDAGQQTQSVAQQLQEALEGLKNPEALWIAYEPLWSIGTQKTPSPEAIQRMSDCIQQTFQELFPHAGQTVPVLYGGSVTAENVQTFLRLSGISGVLVGGASVELTTFLPLLEACGSI